jgi:class 3 adenylate cyclase
MDEYGKDKEWLVDYVKSASLKISIKSNLSAAAILDLCPSSLLEKLAALLKSGAKETATNEIGPVKSFHWFFTDIVASANPNMSTEEQARRIVLLNHLVSKNEVFRKKDPETLVLPTGDGMVIGFARSPEEPLLLAMEIIKELNAYNKSKTAEKQVQIRVGLESGPVFLITDVNGQRNAWGQGSIMARRIMDLGKGMHILASDNFVKSIERLRPQYKAIMHIAGYYSLKHDERALVYNIYGKDFGNETPPDLKEHTETAVEDKYAVTTKRFLFSSIDLTLEIKDIKTMLARHNLFWSIVNITKEPIERIYYTLDGDKERKFSDLNIKITDEKDNSLSVAGILENKPQHKVFYVVPKRPFAPLEKGRTLMMQYDWEEPDRQFVYRIASNCNVFNFKLIAPEDLDLKQKVVKVDIITGEMHLVSKPPTLEFKKGKIIMTWSEKNLTVLDAFRFDW